MGKWTGETNIRFTEKATKLLSSLNIDSVNGNNFSGTISINTAFNKDYFVEKQLNATLLNGGFENDQLTTINKNDAPHNSWQTCDSCTDTERNIYLKDNKICIEFITKNCSSFCNGILRFYRMIEDYDEQTKLSIYKLFPGNSTDAKRVFNNSDSLVTGIDSTVMGDSATLPDVLKRSTEFIKKIITHSPFITVGIYDDMQIDGDVVTVYHNRDTVAFRQRLKAEPITYQLEADKDHPVHRLTMIADNLGSIPPNTSVMVITTKEQKYELKIESTMQKNVGIEIDYQPYQLSQPIYFLNFTFTLQVNCKC